MKRKITLSIILMVGALLSQAYPGASRLHLDLFNDGQFIVTVDGQRFYDVRGQLTVNGLDPGTHRVRVVEVFRGRHGQRRGRTVLYNGSVNIPFRSAVFAHMTGNMQLRVSDIQRLPNQRANRRTDRRRAPDYRQPRDMRYPGYGRSGGNRGYDNRGYGNRGYGNRGTNPTVHRGNAGAFNALKVTLRNTSFDKEKLLIAKQYSNNHRMTSAQVADIMTMFSFDSNRLEFAKHAWHNVIDPQNYFLVNRSFSFSSSTRKLDAYINGGRR